MDLRSLLRAIPPIAKRDELIGHKDAQIALHDAEVGKLRTRLAHARRQREKLRDALASAQSAAQAALTERDAALDAAAQTAARLLEPSWEVKRAQRSRLGAQLNAMEVLEIAWEVDGKDTGYEFAISHGLDVPTQLARYDDIHEIVWEDLPDGFVIKAREGSTSRGVLALQRRDHHFIDLLAAANGARAKSVFVAEYDRAVESARCSADGAVEELLGSPYGDGRPIALDLKLYCFYGSVGMIMIRDCNGSRNGRDYRLRYLAPDGTDLGDASPGRTIAPDLPSPLHLEEVVSAGERLSAAIPTPFVRVDLYEQADRVVFGEITPRPGGRQVMRHDIDRELGRLWEDAEARLRADALRSGVLRIDYGDGRR